MIIDAGPTSTSTRSTTPSRSGRRLSTSNTSDVVDAQLVITAVRLGDDILTGDPDDLTTLSAALGPASPTIYTWP